MRFILAFFFLSLSTVTYAQVTTPEDVRRAVRDAGGVEPVLKAIVRQTASQLPMQTNKNVEMSQVAYLNKTIRYTSRLLMVENKSTVRDIAALKSANINYATCGSPVMSVMIKEYDVQLIYVALSRNNEYLFEYVINKEACQGR